MNSRSMAGWIGFAGILMVLLGGLSIFQGLIALLEDDYYVPTQAGYLVFDIEYRLAPPPRWQDAPSDALCALGWFQGEASRYGVDPARIVVMGDSAGGNLAMVAGYSPGGGIEASGLTPSCDVDPVPPAGVVAMYPVADLAATWHDLRAQGVSL